MAETNALECFHCGNEVGPHWDRLSELHRDTPFAECPYCPEEEDHLICNSCEDRVSSELRVRSLEEELEQTKAQLKLSEALVCSLRESTAETFLKEVYALDRDSDHRPVVAFIMGTFEDLMDAGKFQVIDEALNTADLQKLEPFAITALLTEGHLCRGNLQHYPHFYFRAGLRLLDFKTTQDLMRLLYGLEPW